MDWLSYGPADLVPFSRETWLALLAAYNRQHPPALPAGVGVALVVLWLTRVGGPRRLRLALALLGGCWLWIAWAFLYEALGTLLWAAPWLAWGFAAQGLLLVLAAALLPLSAPVAVASWRMSGWWLLVAAVVLWPTLAWAAGRDWLAVGWFGSAPDATAVGTLGVLAHVPGRSAWLLLALPVLWCALAAVLLQVLQSPLWCLPPLAAAVALWTRWRTGGAATAVAAGARSRRVGG